MNDLEKKDVMKHMAELWLKEEVQQLEAGGTAQSIAHHQDFIINMDSGKQLIDSLTPEADAESVDYCHLNICSVDPPGCTDIDDERIDHGALVLVSSEVRFNVENSDLIDLLTNVDNNSKSEPINYKKPY